MYSKEIARNVLMASGLFVSACLPKTHVETPPQEHITDQVQEPLPIVENIQSDDIYGVLPDWYIKRYYGLSDQMMGGYTQNCKVTDDNMSHEYQNMCALTKNQLKELDDRLIYNTEGLPVERDELQDPVIKSMCSVAAKREVFKNTTGTFIKPVFGSISSFFYVGHKGIDIDTNKTYRPVVAIDGGRILYVDDQGKDAAGKNIAIDHGNGYVSRYLHLSEIDTALGNIVVQGERIAVSGSTGYSTGPHLHLTIIHSDGKSCRYENPLSLLSK